MRTQGIWNWNIGSVCRTDLGEYGELIGCEELAGDLLQTARHIWHLEERDSKSTCRVGCWKDVQGRMIRCNTLSTSCSRSFQVSNLLTRLVVCHSLCREIIERTRWLKVDD